MFPCSRNAWPQKERGERPGALLARRTRTIRMCSFDARSKGQPATPLKKGIEKLEGPRLGYWHVSACQWVGGEKVVRSRKSSISPLQV
jgi:hypothetical protein